MAQQKTAPSKRKTKRAKTKTSKKKLPEISLFKLYEETVQSPHWQVRNLPRFHRQLTGAQAFSIREDFCGTGKISCDWVMKSKDHRAVGLDIDTETLEYAKRVNRAELPAEAQKRVDFLNQNVLTPTREKFDVIGAHNFSFYIFHQRAELLKYARAAYLSLKSKGTFFLEMAGGEGFIQAETNPDRIQIEGYGKVKYVWEQHQYDPVQAVSDYSIHFQLPNGRWLNDAFTYHWRLWGIREVREILAEAGFSRSAVLWQTEDKNGEASDKYVATEHAEHCETWLVYVVGVK